MAEGLASSEREPPDDDVEPDGAAGERADTAFAGIAADAFRRALTRLLPGDPDLVHDLLRDLTRRET